MKSFLLIGLTILVLAVSVNAQALPSTLEFVREENTRGSTDYILKPVVAEIQKKLGGDKPYQILGTVVRPKSRAAVLLLANAQTESQLFSQSNKSVVVMADTVEIKDLTYEPASRSEGDPAVKLEIANVLITLQQFRTIALASSVTVRFGDVVYKLDKDNVAALRFLLAEVDKDLAASR